MKDIYE